MEVPTLQRWASLSPVSVKETNPRRRKQLVKQLLKKGDKLGNAVNTVVISSKNDQIANYNVKTVERLRNESVEEFSNRITHEVNIVQSFDHEYIQKIYEALIGVHHAYIIAEHAEPADLDLRDEKDLWCTFKKLVTAVGLLHDNGFAHIAIMPENILWGKNGHLKLSGFEKATEVAGFGKEQLLIKSEKIAKGVPKRLLPPEIMQASAFLDAKPVDVYLLGTWLLDLVYKTTDWVWREKIQEFNAGKGKSALDPFEWCADDEFRTILERMVAGDPDKRPLISEILETSFMKKIEVCSESDKSLKHWHGLPIEYANESPDLRQLLMMKQTKLYKQRSSGLTLAEKEDVRLYDEEGKPEPNVTETDQERVRQSLQIPSIVPDSTKPVSVTSLEATENKLSIVGTISCKVPAKMVKIRHSFDNWKHVEEDIVAVLIRRSNEDDMYAFEIDISDVDFDELEFAVVLVGDESEIWDNNGGANYKIEVY
ncbi:hypothetical protein HK098_007428 [Nowakowskiella sp. JEL0407]|nr:hypothetical protein HK098_007428 [Nowakowskiella sp. JEL0407]